MHLHVSAQFHNRFCELPVTPFLTGAKRVTSMSYMDLVGASYIAVHTHGMEKGSS